MPEFKYTATDPTGVIHSETMLADNAEEVSITLKKMDLSLINLAIIPDANETFFDKLFNKVSGDDKAQFLEYFASMLESGLTVSDALQAFYEDIDKPLLRKFIKDAQGKIRNGEQLSNAFDAYPDLFPKMYSGMIKVGESSGTLDQSLRHLADQLKKTNELKGKVKNAMIYPAIIMSALGLMLVGMTVFVIPQIATFFTDAGLELPFLTQGLISISDIIRGYWVIILAAILGIGFLYKKATREPKFRRVISQISLSIPIFGKLNKTTNVALLTRTFGSLLSSGVHILEALDVVKASLTNQIYIDIITVIQDDVSKGNTISDGMKKFPKYFAPFEIRVLSMSERTGGVADGLRNVAEFYETKLFGLLSGLSASLEPVLLIVMGGLVVVMALAVITPIFQLLTGVEGLA